MSRLTFSFLALLTATLHAQTITLISGNGQLQPSEFGLSSAPVVFKVSTTSDPNSAGVPNQTITFSSSNGLIPLTAGTVVTNAEGTASVNFIPPGVQQNISFEQFELTASIPSGSNTVFFETQYYLPASAFPYVGTNLISPANLFAGPYTVTAGAPGIPIQVAASAVAGTYAGQPLGNISVHAALLPPTGTGSTVETVRCKEASPLDYEGNVWTSSVTGIATCTPIFSLPNQDFAPGSNSFLFQIVVGDNFIYGPLRYNALPAPLAVSGGLINAEVPFPNQLIVTGGSPPYTFAITSGTLPNGVTLNPQSGIISGTPAATPGVYPYAVRVTDSAGTAVTVAQSIAVSGGTIAASIPVLTAFVGEQLSATVTFAGGVPPLTIKSVTGLPTGLAATIQAGGAVLIAGTAAPLAKPVPLTVSGTDATGSAFAANVVYQVVADLTVMGENPVTAVIGAAITPITVSPSNGEAPYTFTIAGQPAGLIIAASPTGTTGVISGTVTAGTAPGSYMAVITVTDSLGETQTLNSVLNVESGPLAVITTSVPAAFAGLPYQATVQFSGGVPSAGSVPYSVVLGPGAPPGLTLTNGVLKGTFLATGTVTLPIIVTDGTNNPTSFQVPLTVQSVAAVNAGSFVNTGTVAPGEIVSLFGSGFGPAAGVSGAVDPSTGNLATTLNGIQVQFGGFAAPIFFENANQINVQVPYELTANTSVPLVVSINGVPYTVIASLPVAEANPGLFASFYSGYTNGAGVSAVALNAVASNPLTLNAAANPVPRGQYIVLYATGGGTLSATLADGQAAGTSPLINLTDNPQVTIGGQAATVAFAGLAPGFIGLIQVNVLVPESVTPGPAVPVVLSFGGSDNHTEDTTIAIE